MVAPDIRDPLVARIAARQAADRARANALVAALDEMIARLRARGATRVVLFGSLATDGSPHADTDVDLCVWGLDEDARGEAILELEALVQAKVDIVSGERGQPRLIRHVEVEGKVLYDVAR